MKTGWDARVLVLLIVSLIPVADGCSYVTTFVVLNYSSEPIALAYSIAPHSTADGSFACRLAPPYLNALQMMPARQVKTRVPVDTLEESHDYTIDKETCTVRLHLRGGQGVVVWRTPGLHEAEGRRRGFLARLVVSTPENTVTYEGAALAEVFERRSESLYALGYGHGTGKDADAAGLPANNRVNASVRPVTPLACASGAPSQPARYALRSANTGSLRRIRTPRKLWSGDLICA